MTTLIVFSPASRCFVFLIPSESFQDECLHHRAVRLPRSRLLSVNHSGMFLARMQSVYARGRAAVCACTCECVCVFVWWAVTNMHGYRYRYFICFLLQFNERAGTGRTGCSLDGSLACFLKYFRSLSVFVLFCSSSWHPPPPSVSFNWIFKNWFYKERKA